MATGSTQKIGEDWQCSFRVIHERTDKQSYSSQYLATVALQRGRSNHLANINMPCTSQLIAT